MRKHSRPSRARWAWLGSILATVAVGAAAVATIAVSGTAGSGSSWTTAPLSSQGQSSNVDVGVNNAVNITFNAGCAASTQDCLQQLNTFTAAQVGSLQQGLANLQSQTQSAVNALNGQIQAVNAAAQAGINELQQGQNKLAQQTANGLQTLHAEIDANQKGTNAKISALNDLVSQMQKDQASRDAALSNLVSELQQNDAAKFAAVGQQLDNINGDLHSLGTRVSALEQQVPEQSQTLAAVQQEVMSLEARVRDLERAAGYLLSIH